MDPKTADQIGIAFLEIFAGKNGDGSYRYTNAEAFDGLVFMILAARFEFSTLPPPFEGIMMRFFQMLELPENPSGAQISECIDAYFERNPVNEELLVELQRFAEFVPNARALGELQTLEKAAKTLSTERVMRAPAMANRYSTPSKVPTASGSKKRRITLNH